VVPEGVNFCVFGRRATRVELLLYAAPDSPEPFQVIPLLPERNRTFFYWHVLVVGLPLGTCYTWRLDGPEDIEHVLFDLSRRSPKKSRNEVKNVDHTAHRVVDDIADWQGVCSARSGGKTFLSGPQEICFVPRRARKSANKSACAIRGSHIPSAIDGPCTRQDRPTSQHAILLRVGSRAR
jgi:hypothetical protein